MNDTCISPKIKIIDSKFIKEEINMTVKHLKMQREK